MLIDTKKPQNIILCSLFVQEQGPEVSEVFLHELFSHFGSIVSMIVYRPVPHLRALLQFFHDSSVEQALNIFGDVALNFGKISVTRPSPLQLDKIMSVFQQSGDIPSDLAERLDKTLESNSRKISYKTGSGKRTSDGHQEKRSSESSKSCFELSNSKSSNTSQIGLSPNTLCNLQPAIGGNTVASSFIHQSPIDLPPCIPTRGPKSHHVLMQFEPFLLPTNEKSGLLIITSLNTQRVGPKVLMNICCCFGNVSKLVIDPSCGSALVQYNSFYEALEAETCLNEKWFFGLLINVELVEGLHLQFSRKAAMSMTQLQPLHGDFTFYRFQDSLNIKYNPPTNTLHLTNIASSCDQVILFTLLSQIREPIRIIRLVQRGKSGSLMYLAVFDNAEYAMEVLSVLHNKIIDGKSIKASFSRPRK